MIRYKSGGFTLLFEVNNDDNTAVLTGYEGADSRLSVPGKVTEGDKDYPVTVISKKAFLGCNGLREVTLPKEITRIDDWGFAQCIHLNRLSINDADNVPDFGKSVFEGCLRLDEIAVNSEEGALPKLLAAVVNKLPSPFLLRDKDLGHKAWYERWDLGLRAYLAQDDIEGYSDRALCGEEDISYDGIGSVDGELLGEDVSYLKEVSKGKCKLVLLRLMYDKYLSEDTRNYLEKYVTDHSKSHGNEAAWYAIIEDYKDDIEYLKLYMEIVKPDAVTVDSMIMDMGNDLAQAKAYLIREQKAENKTDAFFDALSL